MTLDLEPDSPSPEPEATAPPEPELQLEQEATGQREPARASGKRWLIAALAVTGLLALGLIAFSSYLWNVHSQYVAQNDELREVATSLGTDVATATAHAEEVQAQLDETTAQLDEAKDTINGLANSEAQAGDDKLALVDAAASLKECADARQDLIDHLHNASRWTPESLRANEASITDYCNKVSRAYKELVND